MISRKTTFLNDSGEELAARLELPDDETSSRGFVIFAHCFTCTKDYKSVYHISRELCSQGYAVLRFDFTGLGESGGNFADTTFQTNIADLRAACRFLEENFQPPKLLIGHSLGGAAVLHTAGAMDSVKAVVTIGAPSDLNSLSSKLLSNELLEKQLEEKGTVDIKVLGRDFTLRRSFFDALQKTEMQSIVEGLNKPLMILHAVGDSIVSIRHGQAIFSWAHQPKSFISLPNADHLLSDGDEAKRAASFISHWVDQFVDKPE